MFEIDATEVVELFPFSAPRVVKCEAVVGMDIDDSIDGVATGTRTDDGWEFEEFVPPPKRTTVDEF